MPIAGLASLAYGAYQGISGGIKRRQEEAKLEKLANEKQPNSSILDLYGKALAKYNPNAYESNSAVTNRNQINRNLATGISGIQSRRGGVGAVAGMVQGANDATAKAVSMAEQQQNADLAQLSGAANAKTQEEQKKFDMMYNLNAMKAGQAASTQNSGIKNIYSGISSIGSWLEGEDKGFDAPLGSKRYNKAWDKKFRDVWY